MTTFDHVRMIVCNGESIMPDLLDLTIKTRKREIVFARQCIFYLMKKNTKESLAKIGGYYGKDHATVLHACKTINNLIDTDKNIAAKIAYYEEKLQTCVKFDFLKQTQDIKKVRRYIASCIESNLEISSDLINEYNDLLNKQKINEKITVNP